MSNFFLSTTSKHSTKTYTTLSKKVEEYTKAFHQLVVRVDLNESEEQMVARYLSGLKSSIQDALSLL